MSPFLFTFLEVVASFTVSHRSGLLPRRSPGAIFLLCKRAPTFCEGVIPKSPRKESVSFWSHLIASFLVKPSDFSFLFGLAPLSFWTFRASSWAMTRPSLLEPSKLLPNPVSAEVKVVEDVEVWHPSSLRSSGLALPPLDETWATLDWDLEKQTWSWINGQKNLHLCRNNIIYVCQISILKD